MLLCAALIHLFSLPYSIQNQEKMYLFCCANILPDHFQFFAFTRRTSIKSLQMLPWVPVLKHFKDKGIEVKLVALKSHALDMIP